MAVSRKDAQELLNKVRATYAPDHEYVQVNPEDFKYLDLKYYDNTAEKLIEHGFHFLGDIEDVTISHVYPRLRTFIKCMVSQGGTIGAGIYHAKPLGWLRIQVWLGLLKNWKVLDLETEFTNGCFICTSNAMVASAMTGPPEIASEYYPPSTSIDELLDIHKERVAEYLQDTPDIKCVPVRSLNDVFASGNRMLALKSEFRDQIQGGLLPEEMDRLAKGMPGIGREALHKMQEIDLEQTENPSNQEDEEFPHLTTNN